MILLIDKPKGVTSHDVVNIVRRVTSEKRVGHGGTLDPNATGLLVVAVGRESTKTLDSFTKGMDKEYEAEIVLGEQRDTDDTEGKVIFTNDQIIPSINDVKSVLLNFIGKIEQVPPSYSAVKINGKKSYDLARKNREVELNSRRVTVYETNIVEYSYPHLKIKFLVSSGTYIRALARDIGINLKTGAYLGNLRRTKIGKHDVSQAVSLEEFRNTYTK